MTDTPDGPFESEDELITDENDPDFDGDPLPELDTDEDNEPDDEAPYRGLKAQDKVS